MTATLPGFARGAKAFVILAQPRIASHGVQNHIQSALRSRALPNGIVGLPEKKRFFPDCRSRGATPT
jgi:hypothetical protein